MKGMVKIGEIGVDTGLCWIGDPCYLTPKTPFENWHDFCDKLKPLKTQFKDGICVSTGYGDGVYPVYAKVKNNIVESITIDFMSEEDD
jgi:hypothetical protein